VKKRKQNKESIKPPQATSGSEVPLPRSLIRLGEDMIPVVLLTVLPLLFLGGVLFSGTNIVGSPFADAKSQFFFTRSFGFSELSHFSMPLWNPYIFGGTPFVGTLQSSVFYPLNLIFAVLPIAPAMNWSIAFHLVLSGIFSYYLLRNYGVSPSGATLAGIVFTFSAPQVMHIYAGHLNALTAMVWTPLMFLLLDRMLKQNHFKYSLFLGLTIALQFLAGQPQYVFYTMISLTLYLLFYLVFTAREGQGFGMIRSQLILFVSAVLISIAISSIQILPTFEMTRYSTREALSYEWVSQFSFPPGNLITYLMPDFFGDMLKVPYWGKNYLWEMSAYAGIAPLFFVVAAIVRSKDRVVWFFAGLAVVSVIFALGKYTPVLKFAYTYVPGFHLFRGNSKFIFLNAFSLAVLSGFGWDAVIQSARGLTDKASRIMLVVAAVSGVAMILVLLQSLDAGWFREAINAAVLSGDFYSAPAQYLSAGVEHIAREAFRGSARIALGLVIVTSSALFLYSYGWLNKKTVVPLILAVVVLDLFTFGSRYMVTFDYRDAFWNKDAVSFLNQDKERFRVIAPGTEANSGMANRIETLNGYDTIMIKRYSEYINLSQSQPPEVPNLLVNITDISKLIDLFNAKYILLNAKAGLEDSSLKRVFSDGASEVYQNLNAFPRAFVVHGAKSMSGKQAVFQELTSKDFDPRSYVILEEELKDLPNMPSTRSPQPEIVSYASNRIVIEANLNSPGLLVLGDTYYPGWKAFVDGRETKIYKANYAMRAIKLQEGRHSVEFSYNPASFKIGALISLVALLFLSAFLFAQSRRGAKKE
jgi:uncharacterized membrane protein YfhO